MKNNNTLKTIKLRNDKFMEFIDCFRAGVQQTVFSNSNK